MGLFVHAGILVFAGFVVLLVLLFVVVDMFGRVDYLKTNFPWLDKILERKGAMDVLLLVTIFLLIGDSYEFLNKEVPEIPAPPHVTITPPIPPPITIIRPPPSVKEQCWVRNYSTPGNPSYGLTIMLCNAKYDPPFFLTIEYDQRLASIEAITFPMGGMSRYDESLQDNKIVAYFDAPSIRPNEPFSVIVHGTIQRPPVVTKVIIKTKDGLIPAFNYSAASIPATSR